MQLGVLPLGTGNDLASANSVTSSHTLCFFGGRSTQGHWSVVVLHCLLQYTGGDKARARVLSGVGSNPPLLSSLCLHPFAIPMTHNHSAGPCAWVGRLF